MMTDSDYDRRTTETEKEQSVSTPRNRLLPVATDATLKLKIGNLIDTN